MKKTLLLLPSILLLVFILLSLLDKSDYVLEKKIWNIQQKYAQLAQNQNPSLIPENQFNDLIKKYKMLLSQYPHSDLLPQMYTHLGEIYALKGDYYQARSYYFNILKQLNKQDNIRADILMDIGLTYEKEKNEKQAIQTYLQIIQNYPGSGAGLNAPIYIVNYYLRTNQKEQASIAMNNAQNHYKRLILKNPVNATGFYALGFLARIYLAQERWDDSLLILKSILLNYAESPYMNQRIEHTVIRSINQVCLEKLNDPGQAVMIYQLFLKKHPHDHLNKILENDIRSLQKK